MILGSRGPVRGFKGFRYTMVLGDTMKTTHKLRELPEVTVVSMTDRVVVYVNQWGLKGVITPKDFKSLYEPKES